MIGLTLLAVSPSTADEPAPGDEIGELRERLARVSALEDAHSVETALEQARRAVERAEEPNDDPEATLRAQGIARAALTLAERQLARRRTQEALFGTQRRLTATRERAAAQRRVLEALMRERAALVREGAER